MWIKMDKFLGKLFKNLFAKMLAIFLGLNVL